jgi:hypothetical protein
MEVEPCDVSAWFQMTSPSSEHLANRLLLFIAGRDPKIELKEQTKSP